MRVIVIPEPAIVPIPTKRNGQLFVEERQVLFVDFLKTACKNYEPFCHAKNLTIYVKLLGVLNAGVVKSDGKEIIQFEDEDFVHLLGAVQGSTWLSPDVNLAYQGYYAAVYEAIKTETAKR